MHVVSVSYGCCKSRSGCCICCNGYTRMLQAYVSNVSSVFQTYVANVFIWMLHMFHTYVASILSGCCTCFYNYFSSVFQVFLQVFHMHVSSVSFAFRRMLKMFHLIVSKVDRVLLLGTHLS
jgi:hypothetical protein